MKLVSEIFLDRSLSCVLGGLRVLNIWSFCICFLARMAHVVNAKVIPRSGVTAVIIWGKNGICGMAGKGNSSQANNPPMRMEPIVRLNRGR